MKSRMLGCAALALFAESALNIGADTYGMIPTELGRPIIEQGEALHIARERFNAENSEMFIKLTGIASKFGNEVSQVCFNALSRSQSISPSAVSIDWILYSSCFIQELFRSGISQAKQINDHCQKHVFPSQSQLAQQNIKLGHFYINPNWMFDEARNTAIILPENIGENVLPYLFIQGAPMLQVDEYRNSISIVLTQKVLLGDPRFQPFWTNLICIAGNPRDPLSKGALYIIPPEEAKKAELTGGITLSPYEGKTHGTLFFKIDSRFDLTKIPPTADQARFAALLGLGMTFDVVHFLQEHLMPAYDGLLLYTKQGKNLKLYSPIASKLKEKLKLIDYDRKLMIPPRNF